MNVEDKNYTDKYFEKGHIWLKIWQTFLMILGWIAFFSPCVITTMTYIAHLTHGRYGYYFWHYSEGFEEINFLLVILCFAVAMIAVFCIAIGYVQRKRADGLITKWPTYDIAQDKIKRQRIEDFITERFGPEEMRHEVRFYSVKPEQNLDKDVFKDVTNGKTK
ncbi:MAG: ABC transporter permease [Lactobacillus sp.]